MTAVAVSASSPSEGAVRHTRGRTLGSVALLALVYTLALLVTYRTQIDGFVGDAWDSVQPPPILVAFSVAMSLVPVLWVPFRAARLVDISVWVLFLFAYIPSQLMLYQVADLDGGAISISFALGFGFFVLCRLAVGRGEWIVGGIDSSTLFWAILLLIGAAGVVAVAALGGGLHLESPDLSQTYVHRTVFKAATSEGGTAILGYPVAWLGYVVLPFLVSYGLVKKTYWMLAVSAVGEMLLFSLEGSKSQLFAPLLIVAALVAYGKVGERFAQRVLWQAVGLVLVTQVLAMTGRPFMMYLFTRRLAIATGVVAAKYYEFFSSHPHTLWGDSLLSGIVADRYGMFTPNLIGFRMFGDAATAANANLFADGFAALGLLGVLLAGAAAGLLLRMLDFVLRGKDWRPFIGPMAMVSVALTNSALPTTLLTHGIALLIALAALYPREPAGSRNVRPRESVDIALPSQGEVQRL